MRILVVGGGAREHILAEMCRRAEATVLAAAPHANPGLEKIAEACFRTPVEDAAGIAAFARLKRADVAVIGPEAALAAGVADALRAAGVPVVGPDRAAAQIETSKRFCRELLARHGVTAMPRFQGIDRLEDLDAAIAAFPEPFVVKPVGLTGGKGVLVQGSDFVTKDEGARLARRLWGIPGGSDGLVLEERLDGEEFSLMAFVTDSGVYPLPVVQDYKRALEGNTGGNTGGMGSYSQRDHLLPFLSSAERDRAVDVLRQAVNALRSEGQQYRGVLYGGFMLTAAGPKLIEFNARFGDPEALNVLTLYEPGNFAELLHDVATGTLQESLLRFRRRATVVKYVVPVGYGGAPQLGATLEYDEPSIIDAGVSLYFGTVEPAGGGKVQLTASRGLALVGEASAIWEASERVNEALKFVHGSFYARRDIATKVDLDRRMERVRQLFAPGAKPSPLPLSVSPAAFPPASHGTAEQLI
ncbi:MAG: phosphoribosylamine--glycine ligase [Thermoplasmata archaeon]|nr:phosphoribosylamine--glycine ligase [Thermoplasmata archaeon]